MNQTNETVLVNEHNLEQPDSRSQQFKNLLIKWWPVILLGLATIGAYGPVLYSYGVLIGPIKAETGWSDGDLSTVFSLGLLISGVGATLAGRLLDGIGSRPVMLGSIILGSVFLYGASIADTYVMFLVSWGLGGGIIGAGLFYNVTMAVTSRLFSAERTKAFAVLTFVGGLASPIFFPIVGLMVKYWGWRHALQGEIILLILMSLPAAIFVKGGSADAPPEEGQEGASGYSGAKEAFTSPRVLYMIGAFALMGATFMAVQVHHVPAITATGVALSTGAIIAAVRGFLSLPGRALLTPVVNLLGLNGAMLLTYATTALGVLALALAGPFAFVISFALITGLTYGMIMPLHGLYAAEVFGQARIGTLMGLQTTIVGVATALGPLALGQLIDLTGGYGLFFSVCIALALLAMVSLIFSSKAARN